MMTHRVGTVAVTADSTVSIWVVRALVGAVEEAGVPRAQLLQAAGLSAEQLNDKDVRMTFAEILPLCELAMQLTRDPAFALHWGERLTGSSFIPVSHMMLHSASLSQGFSSLVQFERLLCDVPTFELVEQGEKVLLRCWHMMLGSLEVRRFTADMTALGFFRFIRAFRPHAPPPEVSFSHAAPDYHAEYTRIFEQAVRFEQPFTQIEFDRALLDAPSPYKDEDVHDALRTLAERRHSRLTQRTSYALRVHEFLTRQPPPHRLDMEVVARALGLSERSLRRRLAAEGKSYSEVESDALASVAKHMLQGQHLTVQETAYRLGFADTSAFHRAFKRWTGTTPSTVRKHQQD